MAILEVAPEKHTNQKILLTLLLGFLVVLAYINSETTYPYTLSAYLGNVLSQLTEDKPITSASDTEVATVSVFEKELQPLYAPPVRVYSDRGLFDIKVNEVGVEENGELETPDNFAEGGWYYKSAEPGESGNMIINAHFDNIGGVPAAFFQLKNSKIGDTVYVVDELGREFAYKVTDVFYVGIHDPDRLKVFETSAEGKAELTLITCGGVYSYSEIGYLSRAVVKAELVL